MSRLQPIIDHCGLPVRSASPVHGGDINRAYCLEAEKEKYFLKVNDAAQYPGMFEKEARGLDVLRHSCQLEVPTLIKAGSAGSQQYLLLSWIDAGRPGKDFWESFGTGLAELHRKPHPRFGWEEDNYIGSLVQRNTSANEWSSFYSNCRIMPLVRLLVDSGSFSSRDCSAAESLCGKLADHFPAEAPALLHGDLWGGNFMVTATGLPALIDPAVYCGHREMDLGMTKLFGGFTERFYSAYHNAYPLQAGWTARLPLTQLYPLLVHAVLFGGHYAGSAREIIMKFA